MPYSLVKQIHLCYTVVLIIDNGVAVGGIDGVTVGVAVCVAVNMFSSEAFTTSVSKLFPIICSLAAGVDIGAAIGVFVCNFVCVSAVKQVFLSLPSLAYTPDENSINKTNKIEIRFFTFQHNKASMCNMLAPYNPTSLTFQAISPLHPTVFASRHILLEYHL